MPGAGKHGLGIAIDLGTTTIAAQLVDLCAGTVQGVETELNPQARFGSDVMSRIRAALDGEDLTGVVRGALAEDDRAAGARTRQRTSRRSPRRATR